MPHPFNRKEETDNLVFNLTAQPDVYNNQSAVAFLAPTDPGQNAIILNNANETTTAEIRRRNKENKDDFIECDQADKALKLQLICAIYEIYIRFLKDKYTGHARATILKILTHIYNN